jgi:hypothetical protein
MRGVVLCKSHVVERVQDQGDVCNTGGKQDAGEGGKLGYLILEFLQVLVSTCCVG